MLFPRDIARRFLRAGTRRRLLCEQRAAEPETSGNPMDVSLYGHNAKLTIELLKSNIILILIYVRLDERLGY